MFTFDPTDIDTHQRGSCIEFQFSNGGYDDDVLVKALLSAALLQADYYKSKNRVKNITLELNLDVVARILDISARRIYYRN